MPANQLFHGDCLDILPTLRDRSVNLILCDLPYGTTQNSWDSVIPLDKLWREYKRILAPEGAIVLTSQGPFTATLIKSNPSWFQYKMVWIKSKATNFLNVQRQPLRKHEDICIFYPEQPTYNPQMGIGEMYNKGVRGGKTGSYGDYNPSVISSKGSRYPTDVVYFNTAESEGEVYHPTQKPLALGQYLVRTYSNPGDTVLDNTFGSGSFLVAARTEGRRIIGIEREQKYFDICSKRLSEISGEIANREPTPLFWNGKVRLVKDMMKLFGCSGKPEKYQGRLDKGWTVEETFTKR